MLAPSFAKELVFVIFFVPHSHAHKPFGTFAISVDNAMQKKTVPTYNSIPQACQNPKASQQIAVAPPKPSKRACLHCITQKARVLDGS